MKVWLTGGTGFVGSNIVHSALARGAQVMTTVHRFRPESSVGYQIDLVDMTDADQLRSSIEEFEPDLVIHCAILNDFAALYRDRKAAWDSYVTATTTAADAASSMGASFVVVSTDWVFDGTQTGADEDTPPNPINLYGVLKLASELVALDRGGAVARISGVNGLHRARPSAPRRQDPGFGYFVASLVDSLRRGQPFVVWEADNINMIATPSLAAECAELILDIGQRHQNGVFHCCGRDAVSRMELAQMTCDVFDLDASLLASGLPDPESMPGWPIPYDTSITSPRTSGILGRAPSPIRDLLARFRGELDSVAG